MSGTAADLRVMNDQCAVIRPQQSRRSKQGLDVFPGISAQRGGAEQISTTLVVVAPGERGRAHRHDWHETIHYVLQGRGIHCYGGRLEHRRSSRAATSSTSLLGYRTYR